MSRRWLASRKRKLVVAGLLVLSLALLVTGPSRYLGWLALPLQALAPFQQTATAAVHGVAEALGAEPTSTDDASRREEALRHQVAALSLRVLDLERENALLTGIRKQSLEGDAIGIAGRLIPAQVIADDLLAWRASRLVAAGRSHGVRRAAPVLSSEFKVDHGGVQGLKPGMAVLLAETLIGVVDRVSSHTARVRLLSDPETGLRVRIGRFEEDRFVPLANEFWLKGSGEGRMEIPEVDARDVSGGLIAVGDLVLADAESGIVPVALTVGTIVEITPDRRNPLLVTLAVESPVAHDTVQRVYVFDPGEE